MNMEEAAAQEVEGSMVEKEGIVPGTCVISTIESMLWEITGEKMKIDQEGVDMRMDQMRSGDELIEKRVARDDLPEGVLRTIIESQRLEKMASKLAPIVARMDVGAIYKLVDELKEGSSKVGEVLKGLEIKYAKGGLEKAREYMEEGWSVGVVACLLINEKEELFGLHMFHLGIKGLGRLADKSSDTIGRYVVEKRIENGQLDENIEKLREMTGGWNLLLMRKR